MDMQAISGYRIDGGTGCWTVKAYGPQISIYGLPIATFTDCDDALAEKARLVELLKGSK